MKLGLQGVTILYSSGDNGVAGEDNQGNTVCLDSATGQFINSTSGGRFVPDFPATCPYVTAVGATQVEPGASITQPEIACATVIFSGGGFSDVFPIPSYQESTVSEYFSHHLPPYTSAQYNNSQKARGFPDVSANGAWYVIAIDGEFEAVFGTSCSSPVWGSIITLINEERFNLGKSSVGFINPTLYQNPDALNDITKGTNPGCATEGFSAVPGWDPVTGLGTPNFPKLLDIFLSLK
jgi:tripeptidyl-peptidase I